MIDLDNNLFPDLPAKLNVEFLFHIESREKRLFLLPLDPDKRMDPSRFPRKCDTLPARYIDFRQIASTNELLNSAGQRKRDRHV